MTLFYKYKYNGKEYQDELGLNLTAMDYRQYDNALGRFNCIDKLAEMDYDNSPYVFGNNNPAFWCDPSGLRAHGGLLGWLKGLFGGGSDDDVMLYGKLPEVLVPAKKKSQGGNSTGDGFGSSWGWMSSYDYTRLSYINASLGGGGDDGINWTPSIYIASTLTTLAEVNASKNIKTLEKSGEYWLKLTGKYAGRTTMALEGEKFTKVLMESASKKLFFVGVAVSVISVANDHSASNIALNILDTTVGVMGFIPGMQIPVLIYISARIGYDMYNEYNNE